MTHPTDAAAGLHWRLDALYPGLDAPALATDLAQAHAGVVQAGQALAHCMPEGAGVPLDQATADQLRWAGALDRSCCRARALLADLHVYATAMHSIDTQDHRAPRIQRQVSALAGQLGMHEQRFARWLARWPASAFDDLCRRCEDGFAARWSRLRDDAGRPATDPSVLMLVPEASRAWSALYERLAQRLVVDMPVEGGGTRGQSLTQATAWLTGPDAERRRHAWLAIRSAWAPHETTVAAVLSSLASHRLKMQQLSGQGSDERSASLTENRMAPASLDAMMACVFQHRSALQGALALMAELLGKSRLDPWDLAASFEPEGDPAPSPAESLDIVREAFADVDTSMGDFVVLLQAQGWIDARPGDARRRLGAYQTSVRRGRHPMVFANCQGRWSDLVVMAHEIGHAHHYWLLRDLPPEQHHLPMAMAECASAFAEQLVRNRRADPVAAAWGHAQAAVSFLLNIGASYSFERELLRLRRRGEVDPGALSTLMSDCWRDWFGPSITEYDDRSWARKAHFSGSRPFQNYPYMVGYLVATLLEDLKSRDAERFTQEYERFLCGCATLSFEELMMGTFGLHPGTTAFWQRAVELVLRRLQQAQAQLAHRAMACAS